MRHGRKGRSLSRPVAERVALFRGLVSELIRNGKIRTTLEKAKEVRPIAERTITMARRGDLHARRLLIARLYGEDVVNTAIHEIGPRFASRPGGYTRITRIGRRIGDNAQMAVLEFVE